MHYIPDDRNIFEVANDLKTHINYIAYSESNFCENVLRTTQGILGFIDGQETHLGNVQAFLKSIAPARYSRIVNIMNHWMSSTKTPKAE